MPDFVPKAARRKPAGRHPPPKRRVTGKWSTVRQRALRTRAAAQKALPGVGLASVTRVLEASGLDVFGPGHSQPSPTSDTNRAAEARSADMG